MAMAPRLKRRRIRLKRSVMNRRQKSSHQRRCAKLPASAREAKAAVEQRRTPSGKALPKKGRRDQRQAEEVGASVELK